MNKFKGNCLPPLLSLFVLLFFLQCSQQTQVTDFLPEGTFTPGIEGPAVDREGNLYAVNYQKEGTIGIVRPDGTHELFLTLPEGSVGNGIRLNQQGQLFVADYKQHIIYRIDPSTHEICIFSRDTLMNQPNDLAMAPDGTLYASDPNWKENTGQLWRITKEGKAVLLEKEMGTTNGIEVSPDGKTLYVNESAQLKVWTYDILPDGNVTNKRLFHTFEGDGMDGMRCDTQGNLYLCRHGKGTVAVLSPEGALLREITLRGKKPSNITFGGKENRQCFVTLQDRGCFETFQALYPGRE